MHLGQRQLGACAQRAWQGSGITMWLPAPTYLNESMLAEDSADLSARKPAKPTQP